MTEQELDNLPSVYLIVGLGNPGAAYQGTRHNIGYHVVDALAAKHKLVFRKVQPFHGLVAEGVIEGKKVLLLKPLTYMNSSGESVKVCSMYYKVPLSQMFVICDDIYLDFASLKIKTSGGAGGHNGLKSIESHLGTQVYMRLKVGVGNQKSGDLAEYVLSPFFDEEKQELGAFIERAVEALELWLRRGVVAAMQYANGKKPEKNLGE
jgi:PTH1 family peptidyl-tRNA hydrolase